MKALDNAVLNEIDNSVVAATGNLEKQPVTIAMPSGNYAFGFSGSGLGCRAINSAGIFALSGGNILGPQDLNCGGSIIQAQISAELQRKYRRLRTRHRLLRS